MSDLELEPEPKLYYGSGCSQKFWLLVVPTPERWLAHFMSSVESLHKLTVPVDLRNQAKPRRLQWLLKQHFDSAAEEVQGLGLGIKKSISGGNL